MTRQRNHATGRDTVPFVWSDLDRPPLRVESLRRGLVVPNGPYAELDLVAETGSTNNDLKLATAAPDRSVLVAEYQTAGRGRIGRTWVAPPRSGLFFSVLLRPDGVPNARWGWLPLLVGVAAATAVAAVAELPARLKWPNDLLVGERKAGGILAEVVGGSAIVVGMGLNVTLRANELPVQQATSLAIEGAAVTDRDSLLRAVLRELATLEQAWRAAGGDPDESGLRAQYRRLCATIGAQVRVQLPAGDPLVGDAVDIDTSGRLVVRTADGAIRAVSAGDVVHVRPTPQ
jgi:BirA family biotin operon repressor/biotin-[acetyl-CoA-carboxylase] ligase